jgi:flagellar motor switch protein FliG
LLKSLQKVAIFLLVIGLARGKSIISLMDNDEIRSVVPAINKLSEISEEVQKSVWSEFEQLGYEENMSPSDALYIMRLLFNNSKINNKDG